MDHGLGHKLANRRYHLSEFREIFTALFRIEDRQVQSRVLNAINGIVHGECECRQHRSFVETGVQTSVESTTKIEVVKRSTESKSVQTDTIAASPERNTCAPRIHSRSAQTDSTEWRDSTILRAIRPRPVRNSSPVPYHSNSSSKFIETDTVEIIEDPITSSEAEVVVECETVEEPAKEARDKIGSNHSGPAYSSITIELVTDRDSSQDSTVIASIASEPDEEFADNRRSSLSLSRLGMTRDENQRIIRKRKRKSKVPRVEKAESEPTLYQEILNEKMSPRPNKLARRHAARQTDIRIDSLLNHYTHDQIEESLNRLQSNPGNVIELMKQEFMSSEKMENGYHAIHKAIMENELLALKRQIYILKYRKWNINDILTIDHESPLQLAVKNNSILPIMKELIAVGADVSELDNDSNTLIHLAMMHSESVELLKLLLERIDYKLINACNDSGNTALHIGAGEGKFYMCKALLEFIDKKEKLKTIGANVMDKERLLELYKEELRKLREQPKIQLNATKQGILNATNRRHGRTPLFLALGNNSQDAELLVLMFLANFADPRVPDYTGMDSLQFAAETVSESKASLASLYNDALECSVMFFESRTLLKDLKTLNI